ERADPVLHLYQNSGSHGTIRHARINLGTGIGEHRVPQLRIARGDRRCDRHAPPLRRRQRARLQHRLQVQTNVFRRLGKLLANCVNGAHRYAAPSVCWPGFQLHGQSSSVCSASRMRSCSSTLRPTERSVALTERMMPFGSTMYVTRSAAPAFGWTMPSCIANAGWMNRSGVLIFFRSSWLLRHARCENSLSVLPPRTIASRSAKSLARLSNSTISVGQMNVKSFGYA